MNKKIIPIAVPLLWTAIVFILHVMPVNLTDTTSFKIPHLDKAVHFGMFATLAFLLHRSFQFFFAPINIKYVILVFVTCVAYGGLMEYVQELMPSHRERDVYDWIADIFGTALGIAIAGTRILPFFFRHEVRKPA